jgi:two-component system, NtrC family, sensor kinase
MNEAGQILVIDDSERVLAQVEERLSFDGYQVITTTQTTGNARHLRTVDLVIIDFHMPGIDGGSVAESLRRAFTEKSAALLYVYTSDDKVAADYAKYGFDGAFTHKGNYDVLAAQVRAAFRLIRTRAAREKMGIPGPASSRPAPGSASSPPNGPTSSPASSRRGR